MDKQVREALEAARGWILAVANRVEGYEVVEKIDEALAALSVPTEQVPADDALTPSERAACQQCGSNPHKMSCSVGLAVNATPKDWGMSAFGLCRQPPPQQ